jgi:hypothetical protein
MVQSVPVGQLQFERPYAILAEIGIAKRRCRHERLSVDAKSPSRE